MKIAKSVGLAGIAALLLLCPTADASQWNKLTYLTVNEPIAVPGAVLTPGEYVVKLMDSPSNRHIVRFMNEDQTEVISTVIAIPNYRMRPTGQTELGWYESPAGEPVALRAWFYPGDNFGQEFVYPDKQARKLSKQTKRNVLATDDALEASMREKKDTMPSSAYESARVYSITPEGTMGDVEKGFEANEKADATAPRSTKQYARFNREKARMQERARTVPDRAGESMRREIRHELVMLPTYGVFDNLAFRVDGSTVTLLGQVDQPITKSSAERVVKDIEGVEQVRNEIEVLPVSPNDDRIRLATYRAIYGHTALNRYALRAVPPIHIIVRNGNVTLEGVVASEADKNIAGIQAKSVPGVFSVNNNLRVEAEPKQ